MPVIKNSEELDSPLRPHSMYEARHSKAVRKSITRAQHGRKNLAFTVLYAFTTIIALALIGYVSWNGNFGRVLFPKDSYGQICGISQDNYDYRQMRYLAFFDYTSPNTTLSRCVPNCPNPSNGNLLCNYGILPSPGNQAALIANGSCVVQLTSEPTFFYCIPIIFNVNSNTTQQRDFKLLLASKLMASSKASLIFNQLLYAKVLLGISVGVSIGTTVVWFIITEYLGFSLVVISLVLAQSILLGLTGIVAYLYYLVKTDQAPFLTGIGVLDATIGNELYLLIFTILFSVLAFGLLVGILWYRKSLRMAGLVIQETGKATRNLKSIPIVGLIQSVLCAALLFGLMLVICLCFTVQSVNLPNENISRPLIISYISLWGIWTISIIYLIGRVAVSGAIYKWYWRKMSPEKNYLSPSFKAVFKENFGTIAFGTIAIPLVFIAGLINYAISPSYAKSVRKEDYRLKDNKFDKIGNRVNFLLDSVSQKAWVEVGRSNADFCRSAKVAHSKFHFPTRSEDVYKTGKYVSWLATCLSLMTTCLAALILTSRLQFLELEVVGFIILIIAISSLVFSFGILQNFSAALLTIICCHCVDMEENDGSEFQPYAMPLSLRKLLHLD